MENYLKLSFCIWDFNDISHDDISRELNLVPSITYIKNEHIRPEVERIAKDNGWIYEISSTEENCNDFNAQLNLLLDILEPRIAQIKKYSSNYYCEFSCAIFLFSKEESTPWVHFDKRYNEFVKNTNVEFDFDIY